MTRVLVCGGRNYGERIMLSGHPQEVEWDRERAQVEKATLYAVLSKYHAEAGVECLIEGGAKGADHWAGVWAENHGVALETFEADWENQGSFAGPARNTRMLNEGKPDLVIAFPGGRGTADMVRKARRAGVEVIEIASA